MLKLKVYLRPGVCKTCLVSDIILREVYIVQGASVAIADSMSSFIVPVHAILCVCVCVYHVYNNYNVVIICNSCKSTIYIMRCMVECPPIKVLQLLKAMHDP